MAANEQFRSGFITIAGRPNVGKSTLMNAMIGEKVAIISPKPQTTRSRIMGIVTDENSQIVFLDTPGMHTARTKLGEYMMKTVQDALSEMEGLIVMVDATAVGPHDRSIVHELAEKKCHKALVLNKIDLMPREKLLGLIDSFREEKYDAIIPVSAKTGDGLDELKKLLVSFLPEGPKYFPDDMITDQPEQFICAEIIREKALLHLRDEVPHGIGVEILGFQKLSDGLTEINATVYCEREAHKGIILGKQGSMIRIIGSEARADIEKLLDTHVNLQLYVKVRQDWRNRVGDLKMMGYDNK